MTDKTQPTGAGVPAAQLDAILLAMHLRQRAKLTATGNADALSQNAANVLVAQYDRIAELEALQAAPPAPAAVAVPQALRELIEAIEFTPLGVRAILAMTRPRRAAAAPAQAVAGPIELRGVKEAVEQGGGFWRSCTGCHELNEGHATGPVSKVFGCAVGNGCSECGGIGAVWDDIDYGAMADAMAAPAQEHATQLAGQDGEQEEGLSQAIDERDTAEGWADGLAGLIGAYFGQDIGEHSSAHNPWQEAKDIIEEAEPYRSAAAAPAQAQEDASDAVERAERYEDALRHIAENAFANKDWTFAQLILNGHSIDAARAAQGGTA